MYHIMRATFVILKLFKTKPDKDWQISVKII